MADQNDQSSTNSAYPQRRRSSFVGQAFTDMFSRSSRPSESSGNSPPAQGPITTAAAEASRRRLSVSTLGMSASPNQGSPMSARMRGESVSSSTVDESAIDDEPSSATPGNSGPFARRVSFGARALKDMKGGSASVPAGRPTATVTIPEEEVVDGEKKTLAPTSSSLGRREGFNWADNMRSRAERGSISGLSASPPTGGWTHSRSKSIAVMDTPVRDNPKPMNRVPDQFQERILKGDFYLD
ncbi:hypothetical protein E4T50_06450 [Aureobasidium sp. EXF-12298]|nr:hypothetical protein E4T50_06450 [Aureobasidium sp. EXF-12298]KAI4755777.1 hypothetical protein E4T51_11125 [Aureobasidium sp. EXF-12344]KAI4783563.1 hypothetical protein E4T52_01569 [Aureobasidium sp. EXF-3400]